MRHQTMLVVLATAFSAVCSIWAEPGRAQKPEMTLTPKKDGAFKAQGGSSIVLGSLKDVSSIMQITRSNIDGYLHNPRALVISREPDAASTQLFNAYQNAEVIPEISFKLYKPGDNTKYKIVTLTPIVPAAESLPRQRLVRVRRPRIRTGKKVCLLITPHWR